MMTIPEAFSLLSVPDVSLSGSGLNPNSGTLHLEYVSVPHPQSTDADDRDVYLVLRLNAFELPIDPAAVVSRTDDEKSRSYTFSGTFCDPSEFTISVRGPFITGDGLVDTLETFENIIEQYVAEFRHPSSIPESVGPLTTGQTAAINNAVSGGEKDLRGRLVMINEDTGEIIGEMEEKFQIKEDPAIMEKGHENDPVLIQVPDDYTRVSDQHALQAFASIIPPAERNWISTSANIVGHAISMTTSLLITTITTGASLYVAHSTPSPHHTGGSSTPTDKGKSALASTSNAPPPLPPRALVFLTSEKTRKGLSTVHALSGEAVKVSSKTVALIDSMIRRAMGAKPKRERYFTTSAPTTASSSGFLSPKKSPHPSRTPSPTPSARSAGHIPPPPYLHGSAEKSGSSLGPALPPRRSPSPAPPLPSRPTSAAAGPSSSTAPQTPGQPAPPLPQRRLKTTDHLLISADLILSTLDDSARRVLDAGTEQFGRVMGHKYGPEAAQSSLHLAGTARNVGLVYIDMSGIGRRALLKRAGKTFIKARISSNDPNPIIQPAPVPASRK